jgi:methylated-DNA-protein-cysteine methyltransferase-like protein
MEEVSLSFADAVYKEIASIPAGKVMSYSQVALRCGRPGAARVVGQIAHFGSTNLPWHRLVHADGRMASGFVPGGPGMQKKLLEKEGIEFTKDKVNLEKYQWR